jgi:hypothetical protein
MKSGGGVLLVSLLQMLVGLVLLGIYEGYKVRLSNAPLPTMHACCAHILAA